MKELAPEYPERREFWRPARSADAEIVLDRPTQHVCRRCGGDLVVGSLFCHMCGAERVSVSEGTVTHVLGWQQLVTLRNALGQSTASLAALVLGSIFMLAALLTGFIFAAATVLDWQAVQLWRIEWLLAALASFVAGILLRRAKN
jgi:hypothetical protein